MAAGPHLMPKGLAATRQLAALLRPHATELQRISQEWQGVPGDRGLAGAACALAIAILSLDVGTGLLNDRPPPAASSPPKA